MTVRIPDDVAEFVDEQVRAGTGSRASIITRALQRERRRQLYEQEARVLLQRPKPTPAELADDEALAQWSRENAKRVWADLD